MKVVIRSSSLLFTLLSIIFHVPIHRISKQPGAETGSASDSASHAKTDPQPDSTIESHREASVVLRGARGNQFSS